MSWEPTATIKSLQKRAQVLAVIRRFFSAHGVMEVETPLLASTTVTDPNLESLCVESENRYLQTSPEYFMKRLLASGSGAIYSLAKAFRKDEAGNNHNPEFTMLEWYQPGFDDRQMAGEVIALIQQLKPGVTIVESTYAELFEQACGANPHTATTQSLRELAHQKLNIDWPDERRSLWLDLLFTHMVEPNLPDGVQIVFDYPQCQSALARTLANEKGETVARRFEVYWHRIELANGYWELIDAAEQNARFADDCAVRLQLQRPAIKPDARLIAALEAGMPECAGVALGVDRLLMCLTGAKHIDQVISFSSHCS
ncbi:EF-P lysine aminoacylase EpmA [Teredinibacter haidensis]|mgnify:CR=1 FL=1|uniref:EF-P lysine aminoacylase EpmA n=1 Tax=Teredinibacter haidensis TaxID=2731755 RepID=UPI000948A3AF|nr:EF-P lysine aminoacylase EpmA [Teredinibacter haidensis]